MAGSLWPRAADFLSAHPVLGIAALRTHQASMMGIIMPPFLSSFLCVIYFLLLLLPMVVFAALAAAMKGTVVRRRCFVLGCRCRHRCRDRHWVCLVSESAAFQRQSNRDGLVWRRGGGLHAATPAAMAIRRAETTVQRIVCGCVGVGEWKYKKMKNCREVERGEV